MAYYITYVVVSAPFARARNTIARVPQLYRIAGLNVWAARYMGLWRTAYMAGEGGDPFGRGAVPTTRARGCWRFGRT